MTHVPGGHFLNALSKSVSFIRKALSADKAASDRHTILRHCTVQWEHFVFRRWMLRNTYDVSETPCRQVAHRERETASVVRQLFFVVVFCFGGWGVFVVVLLRSFFCTPPPTPPPPFFRVFFFFFLPPPFFLLRPPPRSPLRSFFCVFFFFFFFFFAQDFEPASCGSDSDSDSLFTKFYNKESVSVEYCGFRL